MKVNVAAINDDVKPALNGVTFSSFKLGDFIDSLAILFIVIGAFVLIVSGLGLFGACCEVKCMLVTYAVLVMVLFLMKVVAVALWFTMKSALEDVVKKGMMDSFQKNYKADDLNNADVLSNAWNYMFLSLDCCGVVNIKTDLGSSNPWVAGLLPGVHVPKTCCTGVDATNYNSNPNPGPCTSGTSGYNTKGCYEAVTGEITTYGNIFVGVGIAILVIELLAVVFAFVICCQAGSKDNVV
ncbi:tetraspanin-18B-like [Crassostrea virginica]